MNDLIERAREFAFNKHNNPHEAQRYGSAPYSKHLTDAFNYCMKYINSIAESDREIVISAIYLHDIIEDTDVSPSDLKKEFNQEIADIVFRVSNERGWSRKEKNFKTYPKIWVSDLAIFVKLCDRLANTFNSKNSDDEKSNNLYMTYKEEYPIFKYALKVRGLYKDMWMELDSLYEN
jgi:(p)ppGpp synthase/HD superfamily hydrolase